MPSKPARIRTAGLAAVAIALVAFVAVLTRDVLRDDGLAGMDPRIWSWTAARRTGTLTAFARTVTLLGNTLTLTVLTLLVAALLLRHGRRAEALLVISTGAGASVLTVAGKRLIGRSRPPATDRIITESSLSYPSGHSLGTMAVIGIIAVALVPLLHRTWTRLFAIAAAVCYIAAVGLSRIYLGVHWPTDVLAGWSIAAVWVLICAGVFGVVTGGSGDHIGSPDTSARQNTPVPSFDRTSPHR